MTEKKRDNACDCEKIWVSSIHRTTATIIANTYRICHYGLGPVILTNLMFTLTLGIIHRYREFK